jgi:modulator of FtsH protease HflC
MKAFLSIFLLLAAYILGKQCLFTVDMREQAIITQFSRVIGQPITTAGLHFKLPFLQQVSRFSQQVLEWDGRPVQTPTKDKNYIYVDNFARWRIADPLKFMQQLRDERTAQSRLDSIIGSETRSVVANHNLIEVIRSDKTRKIPESLIATMRLGGLQPITSGRLSLEKEILKNAAPKTLPLGIELLDVRFKRVNYDPAVSQNIYKRMITEREQIAERYRSEGAGEAAKISGKRDKELNRVQSEAYKHVQELEGAADATATEIYATAYNGSRSAAELFEFLKSMDTLKKVITPDSTLLLTTEGDLMKFLKYSQPQNATTATTTAPLKGISGLPSLLDLPQIK